MRHSDPERMERFVRAVREHPGARPGFLARLLGIPRSSAIRILPELEEHGYLLYEDDRGGLFFWKRRR